MYENVAMGQQILFFQWAPVFFLAVDSTGENVLKSISLEKLFLSV